MYLIYVKTIESELNVVHGIVGGNMFANHKVYSIKIKIIKKLARLVTFLVINWHHLMNANQNLVSMTSHFSNMPKRLHVIWKRVKKLFSTYFIDM